MQTQPFALPTCGGEQVLQLNIFSAIGAGARVELLSEPQTELPTLTWTLLSRLLQQSARFHTCTPNLIIVYTPQQ